MNFISPLRGEIMPKIIKYNLNKEYPNEIPSTSYSTHGIHSYTAKIIPQIPRYFIEKYSKKNDIILDPFCGSGTILLESLLTSRNAIGIDINPLATLISQVKTTNLDLKELESAIILIKKEVHRTIKTPKRITFPNIDYWFSTESQYELNVIISVLRKNQTKFSQQINNFLLVCFSSVIRKSSYADTRMAKTYKSKKVLQKILKGWFPQPIQYFEEALDKNFLKFQSFKTHLSSKNYYVKLFEGDARQTSSIIKQNGIEEVDLVITSPPYINAQDYFRSYKLELWWLELASWEETIQLKRQSIGTEYLNKCDPKHTPLNGNKTLNSVLKKIGNKDKKKAHIVNNYFENMNGVIYESFKILKDNGYFCLITGSNTICEVKIPTYKILKEIAEKNGFDLIEIGKDEIKNRLLPPGRNHNGGIINEEWITTFQKRM